MLRSPPQPLPAFFESLSWENRWEEAEIEEIILYLRTAKAVTVPPTSSNSFPNTVLSDGASLECSGVHVFRVTLYFYGSIDACYIGMLY